MMSVFNACATSLLTGLSSVAAWLRSAFAAGLDAAGQALAAAGEFIVAWLQGGLVFGTLTAIATGLILIPLRRRIHPSILALFWLVVLIKFVVPAGPAWSGSLATLTSAWLPASAASPMEHRPEPAGDVNAHYSLTWVTSADAGGEAAIAALHEVPVAPSASSAWPPVLPRLAPAVALVYLLAVSAVFVRRLRCYRAACRRVRVLPAADADLRAHVERACRQWRTRLVSDVRVSDAAPAPYIIGVWRPTLVLSRRQLADADTREAVILHELAHMRRGDPWVRCLQWIVGTLLFFWPVVAWVNRRIDLARETACDEWALRRGRLSPAQYARCLLEAARPVRGGWFAHRPAAMAIDKAHVERRIEMVLSIGTRRRAGRIAFGLPAACLLGWSGFVLTGANAALPARELVPQSPAADGQPKTVVVRTSSEGGQQIECEIVGGPEDVLWQTDMPPMFMLEQLPPDAIVLMESSGDAQNEDHHVFVAARHGDGADPTLDEFFANHPTADANADGAVTRTERDAYLVALAMSDAAAVLAQFPKADRNADGKLDVTEASLLVIAPMFVDRPAWLHADAAPGGVAHAMVRVARPDGAAGAAPEHDVLVMLDPAAAAQANGAAAHASAGGHKVFVRKVGDAAGTGEARVIVRTNDGAAADAGEHKVVVLNPGELGEEKVVKTPDGKEIRITGIQKNADGSVTGCADNMQIRMRHAGWTPADGEAGGMFNIKLPAPATEWLLSSIDATPTAVEVAGYVPVVESAPLTLFLQLNPKADANGDGVLTLAERDAFVEAHMTQARARVLKQHPDADANGDGLLTNDEMKEFFRNLAQAHKAAAGQQTMQVHVVAPDGGTTDDAIEVEIIKDDE